MIGPFCSQSFWTSVEMLLYDWPILFPRVSGQVWRCFCMIGPFYFPEFLDKCGGAFIWLAHSVPRVSGQVWRCFYMIGPFYFPEFLDKCGGAFIWLAHSISQSFWTSVENCTRPCSSHPIVPATLSLSLPQTARTQGALTKATTCQQMALIPWLFSALCTLCVTESTTGKMDGGWEWGK